MTTTTQVAAVLTALVAAVRVGVPADVVVFDGQPLKISDPDVLVIGWSASGPSVEIDQEVDDLGGGRIERLRIACLASSYRGETDDEAVAFVRTRTVELLDLLTAALEADDTLGGVVSRAEFGTAGALDQAQTKNGPAATIEFTVLAEVL